MNKTNKTTWSNTQTQKIVGVVLAAVALTWLVSYFSFRHSDGLSINSRQRTNIMRQMMGVGSDDQVKAGSKASRSAIMPKVEDDVKVYQLTAEPINWEYSNGKKMLAWGYNGQTPGPEIRVSEGDKIKIILKNNLPKDTSLHFHGVNLPYKQDGVPGISQDAIKQGQWFTYEFTATPSGTHFYHSHGSGHGDEAQQVDMGLYGSFIVEPKNFAKPDKDFTMVLGSWQPFSGNMNMAMMGGMTDLSGMGSMNHMMNYSLFTINGLAYPDIEALNVKAGERVRLRLINPGSMPIHPIHLHGHQFKIVAVDGNELAPAQQYYRNTIPVGPGESFDIEFVANNAGVWALHCHELHHAAGGMVTTLNYEGFSVNSTAQPTANDSPVMDHGMMH
ncbi:MAG: copper oxidase [Patescibacteria group bacterium]